MDDLAEVMPVFLGESDEGLGEIEQGLLQLDRARSQEEADTAIGTIFRATHTLKGNASSMGFEPISGCAHALEGVLDSIRRRALAVTPSLITVLLGGHDALRAMLATVAEGATPDLATHEDAFQALVDAAGGTVEERPAAAEPGTDALAEPAGGPSRRSLRVDLTTLDQAVTHTGELSISLSRLRALLGRSGDALDALHEVDRLFAALRDQMMRLRMVPIGPMLRQQLRTIRDLAAAHGKLARLVVEGDDVEVDAAVRDGLRDPVTHMVRNAVDHALESSEVRVAAGKEPFGTITLRARREAGWVVVEVCDDGAGFRRDRILARARAIGLVKQGAAPSDDDLLRLVFAPGLTTAESVTDLSGRGVGMDVVSRNVGALKGSVSIRSNEGLGSVVTIRVPLTLAIIEGFAVDASNETYVIPMESVRECIGLDRRRAGDPARPRAGVIHLRGEPLPFVQLSNVLGGAQAAWGGDSVVVVEHDGMRAGLLVDVLHGETQAVVRPLGGGLGAIDHVAGATILGNGRVALILDVPAILRHAVAGAPS